MTLRDHRWLVVALHCVLATTMIACARGMDPIDGSSDGGGSDIVVGEGGNPCTGNGQCSAPTPVCDTAAGRCVQCTATSNSCPSGQVCDTVNRRCVTGCARDQDCRANGMGPVDAGLLPDGGLPNLGTPYCFAGENRCVQCLVNEHCPIGSICNRNACVPGCSSSRGCPAGLTCCGNACVNAQNDSRNCGMCGRTCSGANNTCCSGACTSLGTDTNNCGMCGRACMLPNAMAMCASSMCAVTTCSMGYQDIDRNPANGCECQVDALGGACNTATEMGMIAAGGSRTIRGIISTMTGVQYFRVQFARPGNPRLRFMTNPGGGFRMDLLPSCTGTMPAPYACPGRPSGATAITDFSYIDNPPMVMGQANTDNPRMNAWPDAVVVKVTTLSPQMGCMPFEILAQN